MTGRTLLLNQSYIPHKIISWKRAMMMLFAGKIEIVEEYDERVGFIPTDRLNSFEQVLRGCTGNSLTEEGLILYRPSVIRLTQSIGHVKRDIKFSRLNVYTRDAFRCQYCGIQNVMAALNFDHVIPKQLGGTTHWNNIVTSCYRCNRLKANRTPEQAGMKLRKLPVKPKYLPSVGFKFDPRQIPQSWFPYCSTFLDMTSEKVA